MKYKTCISSISLRYSIACDESSWNLLVKKVEKQLAVKLTTVYGKTAFANNEKTLG